jgi:predicted O-methyltransferase YrrM
MNLAPGSPVGDAGYRVLLAAASRRLARTEPACQAVARALWTTAAGRVPAEERAWLDRIAAHREALALDGIAATAAVHPADPSPDERADEAAAACLWMSLPPLLGSLLMRTVRELGARSCLELGTGFGVSAAYQAAALELEGRGSMVTLDVEGMAQIARPALAGLGLHERVEVRGGRIEETLAGAIGGLRPIDFALLDADHTEAGTIAAFEGLLPGLAPTAVLVFDDINWTAEMGRAWKRIRAHDRVAASVTIRRLGIAVTGPGAAP